MKETIKQWLVDALEQLMEEKHIPAIDTSLARVDQTKDREHGDFTTNIALILSKPCGLNPRQLAYLIVDTLADHPSLDKTDIAGPGFINFFVRDDARFQIISDAITLGSEFGKSSQGQGKKVLLEYVSANPTGPLHVGHGRGAAFGASLANILTASGFDVSREYYVNDAGRQMDILAVSIWLRYLALAEEPIVFPSNGYQGDYVFSMAETLYRSHARDFVHSWFVVSENLPPDESAGGDKEIHIDALIARARTLLGDAGFRIFHEQGLSTVLADIQEDLSDFGVTYETWFSEHTLADDGSIQKGIQALVDGGYTYMKDGACWFNATSFGDEKDRVLLRANGQPTYFASDVAYHWNKYHRGFDRVIDIFGADHHGYVARVKAAVKALGHDEAALSVLLVQFAILYRGGKRVQMSTRSGSFVTLRDLREEVGTDAARFFYVMRKSEQHMDFDLDLAKSESNDNPVYYIQYAHARISSVLRQLNERGIVLDKTLGLEQLALLKDKHELDLMALMRRYPDIIAAAASSYEPHQLAYYLRELAAALHSYYNAVTLICESVSLRCARLCLLLAVQQVLKNGMQLLGVSAPESM